MGLKIQNLRIKNMGIVMPEAYAVITNLNIDKDKGVAVFSISKDRDSAFNLEPVKKVSVAFNLVREENPFITAYKKAKEKIVDYKFDDISLENVSVTSDSFFSKWEDDIK